MPPLGATLPIAYPHVLAMPLHLAMLGAEAFPVKIMGLVHVQNRIAMRQPLSAEEPAEIRAWIEGHRNTERGQEFDLHTEYVVAGEPLWDETCTFLARKRPAAGQAGRAVPAASPAATARLTRWRCKSTSFRAPSGLGRRYGFISGDVNPIHMSDLTARAFGFPRAIAHGMWSLGRAASDFESERFNGGCEYSVNFKLPIYMPSWLTLQRWPIEHGTGIRVARRAGREAAPDGNPEVVAVSAAPPPAPAAREERRALAAAAAGYFCLLCGYYMLRPIREALALEVGVRFNSILFTAVLVVSAVLLPIYWWMVGRTPRGRLLWLVCAPFVLVFLALAFALQAAPRDPRLAFVYFVALTSANLYLVSVFWSAMADVWRPELATRFFGYVAAGGSAGALLGPLIVRSLVHTLGPAPLIVTACAFILATAVFVSAARRLLRRSQLGWAVPDGAIAVGGRAVDDLARMAKTPYLLGIAGLIIAGQTIGAFMYSEQGKYVAAAYAGIADRAAVFATMEVAVNLLSLFFQAVVVTWLTRRGSVALSLSAMPLLLGLSFVVLALFPLGGVLLVTQVIRRAADYGLGKPPREMLFTVLNPESKFKSKSLIDTVLQRGADSAGQWLYVLIAGIGLAGIAWLCALLSVVLMFATRTLGRAFESRRQNVLPPVAAS